MSDPTPLYESVSHSFLELTKAAGALNAVSDALGYAVSDIDEGLKRLNLGLNTWVRISYYGPDYPGDSSYLIEELGYAKLNSRWGISLRKRRGEENDPEGTEEIETWPFNEAPRALRLKAIDKIPDLLRRLAEDASKAAAELQVRLVDAQSVAAVISPPKLAGDVATRKSGFRVKGVTATQPQATEGVPLSPDKETTGISGRWTDAPTLAKLADALKGSKP